MNIMKVFAARALSPPVFQLLASTKILATALASWAMLGKVLTARQWLAMLVLTVGVALGQQKSSAGLDGIDAVPFMPIAIMIVNSFLSAAGAVYTEKVLKARQSANLTIFATNLHMSAHTLMLNLLKACVLGVPFIPRLWNLGPWTWAALLNEAVNGILVSALMRHADSIVKNYAFAASIFVTAGLSVPLLEYWPEFHFLLGAILVVISMWLYYNNHPVASNGHAKKMP
jgi:UDP-sugar transporter A1/2/3